MQQYSKDYNRVNWLFNFILCQNREGMDQMGSFTTATKCLKVKLPRAEIRTHTFLLACFPGITTPSLATASTPMNWHVAVVEHRPAGAPVVQVEHQA